MTTLFRFDEDMPTELIARILNHLDFHCMLGCRAVCSKFQHVIDSSPYYHWKLELALAGMEDGDNYPLASSREMLAKHQTGWNSLKWTYEEQLQIHEYGYWELCGNVLAQQSDDRLSLKFMRLPSKSRKIEAVKWTIHGKTSQMHDFCIDPSQDLLVVIEEPFHIQDDFMCQVLLWTLSTGEPHPSVAGTHVLNHVMLKKRALMATQQIIGICGDVLGILFEYRDLDFKEFVFWNWKTGQVIAHISALHVRSFAFLSERHVMFGDPTRPAIVVVDIEAQGPQLRKLHNVENAFSFLFPPMIAVVNDMKIRSDPAPGWKPGPNPTVPFFTTCHNHLIFINMRVYTGSGSVTGSGEVSLYALSSSFLSIIENSGAQKSACFDWLSWGPENTRMILHRFRLLEHWMRYVYGTRHVSIRRMPGKRSPHIYMYDFNQLALRRSESLARSDDTSSEAEWSNEHPPDDPTVTYVNVMKPTKIIDDDIFKGEVESRLGYRMKCWPTLRNSQSVRTVMCTEDGIVMVYGHDTDEEYHVMTV